MSFQNSNNHKKIAIIGIGRWGTNILKTLEAIEGLDVTYLVTSQDLFPDAKNIKILSHWTELFNQDVDAVFIATPPSTHATILEEFIKLHIPCFVEKPLCLDYKVAMHLKYLSITEKVPILVDHTQLFQPAFKQILNFFDLGAVKKINLESMGYGPFREDISLLWDWGSHEISIMLELLKELPQTVSGYKTNSFVKYTFHYPNDLNVSITNSNMSTIKKRNITIYENNRIITFNEFPKSQFNIYRKADSKNPKLLTSIKSNAYTDLDEKPLYNAIKYFRDALFDRDFKCMFGLDRACDVIKLLGFADTAINSNKKIKVS